MHIALLSDIHANIYALDSVYKDFENKKVHSILVAGDLIGYYYWPKKVVQKLMNDNRVICVSGNHEKILSKTLSSVKYSKKYKKKYGSGYNFCKNQLSDNELNWLLNLPKSLEIKIKNLSFFMTHGSLSSQEQYIYPDAPIDLLEANHSNYDFTVFGHTHYPFIKHNKKNIIINPGSVGQPRDISRIASYALINTENHSIVFRKVRFKIDEIITASKKNDPDIPYLQQVLTR